MTDLTKLTVNLLPSATTALDDAAAVEDLSRTDVVNRALQMYAAVARVARQHDGAYWVSVKDFDDRGDLHLMVARDRPKRRWWRW